MTNNIQIQLIDTNDGYLDLKAGTDFPVTFSVAEIRDITKRKGTYSKTITLAGSRNNNKLLNQYFDVNVIAGTFNINQLQKCVVSENGVSILNNAYMQLISIKKLELLNK